MFLSMSLSCLSGYIRYADDKGIITDKYEDIRWLLSKINIEDSENDLEINKLKINLWLWAEILYVYLYWLFPQYEFILFNIRVRINEDWDQQSEIKCHIQQARPAFTKLRSFLGKACLSFVIRDRMAQGLSCSMKWKPGHLKWHQLLDRRTLECDYWEEWFEYRGWKEYETTIYF